MTRKDIATAGYALAALGVLGVVMAASPTSAQSIFSPTQPYNGPNGFGTGITSVSSAVPLTNIGPNSTLVVTNTNTTDTIYVRLCPTSNCVATSTNGVAINAGMTWSLYIGSNTYIAGISSGSGPDVTYMQAGGGPWTGAGGGTGGGGGGGGAVTLAAGAVAAGAYVSGSVLSGAYATGSIVDLVNLITSGVPCASPSSICREADSVAELNQTVLSPLTATSTNSSGTITTGNTFQTLFASSPGRKGCIIQNTNASDILYVSVAVATGSATKAGSIQVAAGGVFNCASPAGVVATDNIAITASTTSDTFAAVVQ